MTTKNTMPFITQPTQTRSKYWCVGFGELPIGEDLYDQVGNIKKKYITEMRFFKRKINAEKYKKRVSGNHWLNFELKKTNRLN